MELVREGSEEGRLVDVHFVAEGGWSEEPLAGQGTTVQRQELVSFGPDFGGEIEIEVDGVADHALARGDGLQQADLQGGSISTEEGHRDERNAQPGRAPPGRPYSNR